MPESKQPIFQADEDFAIQVDEGVRRAVIKDFLADYHKLKEAEESKDADNATDESASGLYYEADGTIHLKEKTGEDIKINTTIELGSSGKGKLLISCEEGIANTVLELADDVNHLPHTKTGVVVHYLVEGLARDFGIAFDRPPVSLGGMRRSGGGGRNTLSAPSKKEKNALLAKLDLQYYQDDISNGLITIDQAFEKIQDAYKQKQWYEAQGFYLSPNKTEGVLVYDWKSAITNAYAEVESIDNPTKIYTRNKIEVVIPNLWDEYFSNSIENTTKKKCRDLYKSALFPFVIDDASRLGVINDIWDDNPEGSSSGGFKGDMELKSILDILRFINYDHNGDVMGVHLVKNKNPGMMKPRWILVDALDGGKQTLYLYGRNGEQMTLKS